MLIIKNQKIQISIKKVKKHPFSHNKEISTVNNISTGLTLDVWLNLQDTMAAQLWPGLELLLLRAPTLE